MLKGRTNGPETPGRRLVLWKSFAPWITRYLTRLRMFALFSNLTIHVTILPCLRSATEPVRHLRDSVFRRSFLVPRAQLILIETAV